jgi:hypothetical protein
MRRRGVRPSVSQRLEANRAFAKGMQDVEQVAMASRSSRVTISTSPGSSRRRSFASSGAVCLRTALLRHIPWHSQRRRRRRRRRGSASPSCAGGCCWKSGFRNYGSISRW